VSAAVAVLTFAAGSAFGSFLNVVLDRIPAGQSLLRPGSICPSCRTPLRALDLVPVASYLWLRGKCRYCRAPIPVRLLIVEATAGVAFLGAYVWLGVNPAWLLLGAVACALVVSASAAVLRR
jgi:leader peptidase (prepilin peptidase)/N-methyltransferase